MEGFKPLDDTFIIGFGKHKGKALANVPPAYLIYIYENNLFYERSMITNIKLKEYIKDNMELLKKGY